VFSCWETIPEIMENSITQSFFLLQPFYMICKTIE
jgi:hypothetical protein